MRTECFASPKGWITESTSEGSSHVERLMPVHDHIRGPQAAQRFPAPEQKEET